MSPTEISSVSTEKSVRSLDMKLEVAFEKIDDEITLPLFRPAKG